MTPSAPDPIEHQLYVLAETIRPQEAFRMRLEAQLLSTATVATGTPLRWGRPLRQSLQRAFHPWVLGAGLGLLLLGGLLASMLAPSQVTAAEILQRANAATGAVQSYTGLRWIHYRPTATDPFIDQQKQIWFQAPDRVRAEWYAGSGTPAAGTSQPTAIEILTDQQCVVYDIPRARITWQGSCTGYGLGGGPVSPDLPQQLSSDRYTVQLVGQESVAGYRAYILDLMGKPGSPPSLMGARARVWIDQVTYLQLRWEEYDAHDNLLYSWRYQSLTVNSPVAPDRFVLVAPPTLAFLWQSTPPAAVWIAHWQSLATQANLPLRLPPQEVGEFRALEQQQGTEETADGPQPWIEQTYRARYKTQKPGEWDMRVRQSPISPTASSPSGQQIHIGDQLAEYVQQQGRKLLRFTQGDTAITIEGSRDVTQTDLVRLATGIQALPTP